MVIIELTKEEALKALSREDLIGAGSLGLIKRYNDEYVLKIYYKDFLETYYTKNSNSLDVEVALKNDTPIDYEKNRLIKTINALKNSKSELIQGLVTYHNCIIGVVLKSYIGYKSLSSVFPTLNKDEQNLIRSKIDDLVKDLFDHDVYPSDICSDNILINPDSLDVEIIDLDGYDTRVESKDYISKYPSALNDSLISVKELNKTLNYYQKGER